MSCCQVRNTTCRRIDGIIATAVGTWSASLKLLQTARSCGKHQDNFLYPYGGWGGRCLKTALTLNKAVLDWMKTTGMLNRTTTSIVDASHINHKSIHESSQSTSVWSLSILVIRQVLDLLHLDELGLGVGLPDLRGWHQLWCTQGTPKLTMYQLYQLYQLIPSAKTLTRRSHDVQMTYTWSIHHT